MADSAGKPRYLLRNRIRNGSEQALGRAPKPSARAVAAPSSKPAQRAQPSKLAPSSYPSPLPVEPSNPGRKPSKQVASRGSKSTSSSQLSIVSSSKPNSQPCSGPASSSETLRSSRVTKPAPGPQPKANVPPARPYSLELQAKAKSFIDRCNDTHFRKYGPNGKKPDAERYACWKTAMQHVQDLSAQASSGTITAQDELQQFLAANWDGMRLAAWMRHKECGEWASGEPMPLPHIRERTKHKEVWDVYERLQKTGDLWHRFGCWDYGIKKIKEPIEPDEWLVATCLIATFIRPDEVRNKLTRDSSVPYVPPLGYPFRLDIAKGCQEAADMLQSLAENNALAKGDDELKKWLKDWMETHHYMYRLVFGVMPSEKRRAEEADANRRVAAEEALACYFAEQDRKEADIPPSSPIERSYSPPRNSFEWDTRKRIDDLSSRVYEKFEPKYAPWGTNPNAERCGAWITAEAHVSDLYWAFKAKQDADRKEELEQCLKVISSGWDGIRLVAWMHRKSCGEWAPNDPMPVARVRKQTLRRIESMAGSGERVDSFWELFWLVQRVGDRDDEREVPLWDEYDAWDRFVNWCKRSRKTDPDMFFVPVAYLASWLCPGLMEWRLVHSKNSCTAEQIRGESIEFLNALATEKTILEKSNSDFAEWVLEWVGNPGCGIATQFIFGQTPLEIREELQREEEYYGEAQSYLKPGEKTGEKRPRPYVETSDGIDQGLLLAMEAGMRVWKRLRK